jgi:hypothetical protein
MDCGDFGCGIFGRSIHSAGFAKSAGGGEFASSTGGATNFEDLLLQLPFQ